MRFIAHDTCERLRAWIEAAGIAEGPLFRSVRKGGGAVKGRLDAGDVARIYRRRAKAAKVEIIPSGHSTRVGAAQDLVAEGLGIAETMNAGGWRTATMVSKYTEHLQARRSAMAKLAAKQNRL